MKSVLIAGPHHSRNLASHIFKSPLQKQPITNIIDFTTVPCKDAVTRPKTHACRRRKVRERYIAVMPNSLPISAHALQLQVLCEAFHEPLLLATQPVGTRRHIQIKHGGCTVCFLMSHIRQAMCYALATAALTWRYSVWFQAPKNMCYTSRRPSIPKITPRFAQTGGDGPLVAPCVIETERGVAP